MLVKSWGPRALAALNLRLAATVLFHCWLWSWLRSAYLMIPMLRVDTRFVWEDRVFASLLLRSRTRRLDLCLSCMWADARHNFYSITHLT